jgi:RecB family exonuclease
MALFLGQLHVYHMQESCRQGVAMAWGTNIRDAKAFVGRALQAVLRNLNRATLLYQRKRKRRKKKQQNSRKFADKELATAWENERSGCQSFCHQIKRLYLNKGCFTQVLEPTYGH